MFTVYILWSDTLMKYYVGQTNDLSKRLQRHNSGQSVYTSKGHPWTLVYSTNLDTRSQAVALEKKIKKRGIRRFLDDLNL